MIFIPKKGSPLLFYFFNLSGKSFPSCANRWHYRLTSLIFWFEKCVLIGFSALSACVESHHKFSGISLMLLEVTNNP